MRKSVVLPAPFGPTRPTFSPGLSWNEASTKRIWRPYCLLMRLKLIIYTDLTELTDYTEHGNHGCTELHGLHGYLTGRNR